LTFIPLYLFLAFCFELRLTGGNEDAKVGRVSLGALSRKPIQWSQLFKTDSDHLELFKETYF
jgi:hypothetical protein